MSYILDALRKADAQRERDPSRGIHAHPTPLGASASNVARAPWTWGVAAVVIGIAGWAVWHLSQDKSAAVAPSATANSQAPQAIAPVNAAAPIETAPVAVEPPQVPAT